MIGAQGTHAGEREDFIAGKSKSCQKCDLAEVSFKRRDLTGVDLTDANLKNANLHDARLIGAKLDGAQVENTIVRMQR